MSGEITEKAFEVLLETFGHKSFKSDLQQTATEAVLKGECPRERQNRPVGPSIALFVVNSFFSSSCTIDFCRFAEFCENFWNVGRSHVHRFREISHLVGNK